MESECDWADLPAELLAIISDCLEDTTGFRGVCRSWRSSSVMGIPNKISRLFPHTISISLKCKDSRPHCLVANAVYHIRSYEDKDEDEGEDDELDMDKEANWIVSVHESKPGKLSLSHALTLEPLPGSSGFILNNSGLTLTQLSTYHSFHSTCLCRFCKMIAQAKVVVFPNPADDGNSMALYEIYGELFALRRCLTNHPAAVKKVVQDEDFVVRDFVDFKGRIYAVGNDGVVSVLDHTLLRLLPLTCAVEYKEPLPRWAGKRFVVSNGDLYLVFLLSKRYEVYKLKMNDINAPTSYHLKMVPNLGDKVFVLNNDCSFSVLARTLPPPFVGNCILLGERAFNLVLVSQRSCIYHLGQRRPSSIRVRRVPNLNYSPLFHPNQLLKVASQIERKRNKKRNKDKTTQIERERNKEKTTDALETYHIKRFSSALTQSIGVNEGDRY